MIEPIVGKGTDPIHPVWPVTIAPVLAALVAAASLGGILIPANYARETAEWAGEAIAQDWLDLMLVVPLLIVAAGLARSGRPLGRIVLAGTMLFTAYSFAIYAFDIHFNRLLLLYCGAFGLSVFGAARLMLDELAQPAVPEAGAERSALVAGWYLVGGAVLFAGLWLAMIIPSTIAGVPPEAIAAAGVPTNPVHVIDLSLYLPAQLAVGVSLLRNGAVGRRLAEVFLTFVTVMAANLATIAGYQNAGGLAGMAPVAAFALFGGLTLAILIALHRRRRL